MKLFIFCSFPVTCKAFVQNRAMHIACTFTPGLEFGKAADSCTCSVLQQRQALVEAVGTEDRGLPDELISYLHTWTYKASGFFSRKTNHEEYVCLFSFSYRF